jgi:hypothetical protein
LLLIASFRPLPVAETPPPGHTTFIDKGKRLSFSRLVEVYHALAARQAKKFGDEIDAIATPRTQTRHPAPRNHNLP